MTVTSGVISMVYPVAGGAAVTLATRGTLEACRRFVVGPGQAKAAPPGHRSGGAAWVWTALSWAVSIGVGVYAGSKLVRPAEPAVSKEIQPAQS